MKFQILQVNEEVVSGSITEYISDCKWVVVTDIPRQMLRDNYVQGPKNTSLVVIEEYVDFSEDVKALWTDQMAKKFKKWLVENQPEQLYLYNKPFSKEDYTDDRFLNRPTKVYLPPEEFFRRYSSETSFTINI